jgi:hypothetical protein
VSSTEFGRAVAVDEFIVVGEYDSVIVFGNSSMMEATATTATTGSTVASGTTSTVGTTISTGDVILYTSGTGSITNHTITASSSADGNTYSQPNTTNSLTSDSVSTNWEEFIICYYFTNTFFKLLNHL